MPCDLAEPLLSSDGHVSWPQTVLLFWRGWERKRYRRLIPHRLRVSRGGGSCIPSVWKLCWGLCREKGGDRGARTGASVVLHLG